MHSSRMRTGRSLTVSGGVCFWSPELPPWLWAWTRSPSISPLAVGLETTPRPKWETPRPKWETPEPKWETPGPKWETPRPKWETSDQNGRPPDPNGRPPDQNGRSPGPKWETLWTKMGELPRPKWETSDQNGRPPGPKWETHLDQSGRSPPVNRSLDTRYQKYYLGHNFVEASKKGHYGAEFRFLVFYVNFFQYFCHHNARRPVH